MNKNGFTLAETLITLSIIGIAAVLISPSLRQLIPSKNKMEFMECYKQITTALPLVSSYYTPEIELNGNDIDADIVPKCVGLGCVNIPDEKFGCSGSGKIGCVIDNLVGIEGKYSWSGNATIKNENVKINNKNIKVNVAKSHEVTCTTPSKKEFTFKLTGNGTIENIGSDGARYMEDQFNFYDKGEED